MPDHEDSVAAIAHRSLEPLLAKMHEVLVEECAGRVSQELFLVAAEIYAVGHRDGVRHAVGDIAPTAARHGLRLWLDEEPGEGPDPEELAVGAMPPDPFLGDG